MDLKEIQKILDMIADSEVNQVTIEEGDFKIKVKKTADVVQGSSAPVQYQMPPAQQQQAAPAPAPSGGGSQPSGQQASSESSPDTGSSSPKEDGNTLKSPIVGTFYRSPSPEDDAFVQVGDQVQKGDTLCIVEAMKIMNEIESEFSGEIKKILVDDGEAVEFEQPLFIIG